MVDLNHLCPGCMRELKDEICPHCGFSYTAYQQNLRCLPLHTILAGKYLVGKVLGQGGFGITYIGFDLNMESRIAIKEYFPVELVSRDTSGAAGDRVLSLSGEKSITYQQGLKKYVAEARNVSRFSEIPGVVSIKDFFYENETAYIIMEYIEGESLKEYLKQKGPLTEAETLSLMKPVLEALEKVHASGMIHRDISPDNIMLTFREGAEKSDISQIKDVKLIDFGAARMAAGSDPKSLTIVLKHGYAPEEQYRTHGEQGTWTDIYAVCATMYRMLTGSTPEPAMDRLFEDRLKSFEDCRIRVSRNTADAILKGLAVKKENRISTVRELMQSLYEGKKTGKRKPARRPLILMLSAGIALSAAAFLFFGREAFFSPSAQTAAAPSVSGSGDMLKPADASLPSGLNDTDSVSLSLDSSRDTEELGPQIVWPRTETMAAGGTNHLIALYEDGTVRAAGNNRSGQCDVSEWEHIAAVYAAYDNSAGLRTDGTVAAAGAAIIQDGVTSWKGVTDLALGANHILGLLEDGTVLSAGNNHTGCCETGSWTDIESVWASLGLSVGIKKDGSLVIAGTLDGQEELIERVKQWTGMKQIVICGDSRPTFFGLRRDGTVLCMGNLESAGYQENLASWKGITRLAAGDGYIAGLRADGTLQNFEHGLNDQYAETSTWTDIRVLTGTLYNLAGIRSDGTILVTEPTRYGNSTLEEILSLDNAVQAAWTDQNLSILCRDGTVRTAGYIEYYMNSSLEEPWTNLTSITGFTNGIAGITAGQTVRRTGFDGVSTTYDASSGLTPQEWTNRAFDQKEQTPDLAAGWTQVTDISCSSYHIAALLSDGTVRAAGYPEQQDHTDYRTGLTKNGSCLVSDWTDIRQVLALNDGTLGLKNDGTLVMAGELPKQWSSCTDLASIWGSGQFASAIRRDGTVQHLRVGNDEYGQTNTASWTNLVQLALSSTHTAGLKEDGTVVAVGSNYCGQCEVSGWSNVVSIAAGPCATVGITGDGRVLMAGTLWNDFFTAEKWPALFLPPLS